MKTSALSLSYFLLFPFLAHGVAAAAVSDGETQTCTLEQDGSCVPDTQELELEYIDLGEKHTVIAISNFFTPEQCEKYRNVPIPPNSTRNHDEFILVGEVEAEDEDVEKLIRAFAAVEKRDRIMKLEEIPGYSNPRKVLHAKHTHLHRSSDRHQDYYTDGVYDGTMVTGNNAFIFLNSNQDASFQHADSPPIPATEGTLLIFPGAEWHQTDLLSGDLHLFGPMDTDYLVTVGFSESPSAIPSAIPSTVPSKQPSQDPSTVPSKQPSQEPSTSPTELDLCRPLPNNRCTVPGQVLMRHDFIGCFSKCVNEKNVHLYQFFGWKCGPCP